jgi:hypothetical protein
MLQHLIFLKQFKSNLRNFKVKIKKCSPIDFKYSCRIHIQTFSEVLSLKYNDQTD